jgi:nitrile hydratase
MPDEVKAPAPVERRVAALERAFEDRNLIPAGFIDDFAHIAQEDWVPANGARVVARAWTDPDFKRRLLENGRAAVAELGFTKPEHHKHLVVLENTPNLQNVICCTLCSCTAFTIIGLPPGWYKDFEYRSRVVRQSRTVLREMGLTCRTRSRSRCGTPPPTPATWCCRCSRPKRSGGPRTSSPKS